MSKKKKSLNPVIFSNKSDEWETPQDLFDKINKIIEFNLDAAASAINKKCEQYFSIVEDSLKQTWSGNVWLNPPYSVSDKFIKKAYDEVYVNKNAKNCVILIPSRTDTKYFQNYCCKGERIIFIKGRLRFNNSPTSAPFPSCLIFFGELSIEQIRQLKELNLGFHAIMVQDKGEYKCE